MHSVTAVRRWTTILAKQSWSKYKALPFFWKLLIWFIIGFDILLLVLVLSIGPAVITQKFYDFGQEVARYRYGWMILGLIMTVLCFPPLILYHTSVSLCGFTYGLKGFFVAAPAALFGSGLTFIILRYILRDRLSSWSAKNQKWQALETVIKEKGLPLIILIRVSPFPPWVYANAFFASINTVSLWQFLAATVFVFPKLFLSVFIGSRVAELSDGKQRGQMDTTTKILNFVSVFVSIGFAVLAGIITYRLLQKQVRELHESPDSTSGLAADALEEAEEGAPLLQNVS
ncbi:Golgi apparatus membrane TVP38 [Pyrrhoderma noxium]|uniref:Golgi apparatus membrane protein TVP38 n=1 Tax=Pyrrhoderma noxium TaxID=2282107 RepID=A0A286UMZ5_9AGAM|nr:Golgi apparatus membrane TVP38 [Pyrrhoderma noxium]